jgi:hypothetical protein
VKPLEAFLAINFLAFLLLPVVMERPNLEEFRPAALEQGQEVAGSQEIFRSLLIVTVGLVVLKVLKVKLAWIIDLAVFSSGFIFGSLFGLGPWLGLLLLALRKMQSIAAFNVSSAATIICFSLLLAPFVTPGAAMTLMALLSIYDVVGVLYLPYIKFLWLRVSRDRRMESIAILFKKGMVGAGDFALPLLFSLSFGPLGLLSVPLLALGFSLNNVLARRLGAFPGIPFQALFAYLFYVVFA